MIVSMQGNWTVTVKAKNAAFAQRFVVSGATSGNGPHAGTPGTTVAVTGSQWTIAIQNDPGTGFQVSQTKLQFPQKIGNTIRFDIRSNDAGGDEDFDDLILTCSSTVSINDFVIFGNVSQYSGPCVFNPCRFRDIFVIETPAALLEALKNPHLREVIGKLYPERIPDFRIPNPPDPPDFKPVVLDAFGLAAQPKTAKVFKRVAAKAGLAADAAADDFELVRTVQTSALARAAAFSPQLVQVIDGYRFICDVDPAPNITLTFEEYDRTAAEKAGGAYTGTGPRQLLGDTITDVFGNYIFRFRFDLTVPGLADAADIAPGEDVDVIIFPDVIVKVTGFSPSAVLYESAPYYNIPNLKRIDLCLPKSRVPATSACFNGNLIGSLGNVFLGGNQNTTASTAAASLRRYGNNNFQEANGKITVGNSQALFTAECAAWTGVIDMRGCLYDAARTPAANTIRRYTIRVRRAGTTAWEFVSQNYKHPKFSKRNLANYNGDDVGPFATALHVDGGPLVTRPAYINIQREIFADGVDWEFSNFDRFMQLNTALYDFVLGVRTPGTLHVRVDGYDAAGNPVPGATDMIALFVQNKPLDFQLTGPSFSDPAIVDVGCGLFRLTAAQMNSPLQMSFKANDPFGFVDSYSLTMGRCPAPTLALRVNLPPSLPDTPAGAAVLAQGNAAANVHNACPGYTGTLADFGTAGTVPVEIQPALSEGGWLRTGEEFVVMSFSLSARMRVTNGYNSGLSGEYRQDGALYLERV
ncbi:MAG: hypothetical protein FJW30_12520 [Acidobacteria bacterium]|nr:hypothetical protein [Acidobacteriota bacterium]